MALVSTVYVMFLVWCSCTAGHSSARSVPSSMSDGENDADVGQMLMPYDVQCDLAGCEYDLQLFCLDNGVIVMGSCSLKKTLCQNGRRNSMQLANSWESCFLATYTVILPDQSWAAGGGDLESGEETEEENKAEDAELANSKGLDQLNMELEHELLTNREEQAQVKAQGSEGQNAEVEVHGDTGGRA